jgi:hypothetical protein
MVALPIIQDFGNVSAILLEWGYEFDNFWNLIHWQLGMQGNNSGKHWTRSFRNLGTFK